MIRLVIGCGYLGYPAARQWAAAGDKTFVLTRSPAGHPAGPMGTASTDRGRDAA